MNSSIKKPLDFSKGKRFILLSLTLAIVAVIIWVFQSIFAATNSTTIPPEAEAATTPLDPNLNVTVLDQLGVKNLYSEQELQDFSIYVVETDTDSRDQKIVPLERDR